MTTESAPRVQILLSTYNGERFLGEQLDSLLAQDYPNIHILIRDDGSSDGTIRLLETYLSERITLLAGENIGVVRSFFKLLEYASADAAYFAFCDQDDVWLPHKVSRAVQALAPEPGPTLYCSSLILTDANLKRIGRIPRVRRKPSFANALLENIATGCTTVLNRAARELLVHHMPDLAAVRMHDRWFYQTLSAFGEVIFDTEATVLYRQHAENVVGAKSSPVERWIRRYENYRSGHMQTIKGQATEFSRVFNAHLKPEDRESLEELLLCQATFKNRLKYVVGAKTYRQTVWDTLALRALLATGLI